MQQLRDGVPNFFVTFIQTLHDRDTPSLQVDKGVIFEGRSFMEGAVAGPGGKPTGPAPAAAPAAAKPTPAK